MKARAWLALPIAAALLQGCGSASVQSSKPPTAAEILAKPEHANVKDAHFTLTAHVTSGNVSFDATGDGVIVIKPEKASKLTFHMTVAGQTLQAQEIIVGGKEYDLSPDNPRWTVKPSTTSADPSELSKGKNATLVGEETLQEGKAWHVKASDESGNPFDAWVRESDGYPLKFATTYQGTTFSALFDRFNTGETVTAPPASDIQQ